MTPEQLAKAVYDEEISFEDALIYHMLNNLGIAVEDVGLFIALSVAIGWANLGEAEQVINLPGEDGPSTVADIIQRFNLEAFVEK